MTEPLVWLVSLVWLGVAEIVTYNMQK